MVYKILLTDDNETQLDAMQRKLLDAGYEVTTATSATEAYIKTFHETPDLVLSDVMMDEVDGYDLCRLLKNNELTKSIPVALITVLDKKMDKFSGETAGADKFLSKDTDFSIMKPHLEQLIAENPVSDETKEKLSKENTEDFDIKREVKDVLNATLMKSTFMNKFRDLSENITHEKVLLENTFKLLSSFTDYNLAGIFFKNPDSHEKNILHLDILDNQVSSFVIEKLKRNFFGKMPDTKPFTITEFSHEIIRENTNNDFSKIVSIQDFKSNVIIPIKVDGKMYGGICFYSTKDFKYEELSFFSIVVDELVALFKSKYTYSETEYLSVTDGLTGLYNRRLFEYNVDREFARTKRYPKDLSLAILDIDFFKSVNDTYGHQFGDYVLREVANLLKQSFRKTDMIYRYGGEELTIILAETSIESAVIPLERLRKKIQEHVFEYNNTQIHVTVSIGIGSNYMAFDDVKQLVESADKALYKAKQTGRNKVVVYSYEQLNADIQQ